MNRINQEIHRRTYTMDIFRTLTKQEQKDWKDMWMLNDIICAIHKQHNVEG